MSRRTTKKTLVCVFIGMTLIMLATLGWTGEIQAKKFRVGMALKIKDNPFFISLTKGAESEAAKYPNLDLTIVYAEEKAMTQIGQVESFVAAKVDALIISAVDTKALISPINAANRANIPVFCVDTGVEGGETETLVASDNHLAGLLGSIYMVKRLGGKGNVILIEWPTSQSCRERIEGVEAVLSLYPDIKIIHREMGKLPPETTTLAENILTAFPNVDAIYTVADIFTVEFYRVIKMAGKEDEIFLVSVDATPEARKLMKESADQGNDSYGASVAQQPFLMGELSVRCAMEYLTGEKASFPDFIPVEVKLISKENVEE